MLQNKNHDYVPQPRDLKRKTTYFIKVPRQTLGQGIQNGKTKRQPSFHGIQNAKSIGKGSLLFVALGHFKIGQLYNLGYIANICPSFKQWIYFFTCKNGWARKNEVAVLEGKLICHPTMHQHSSRVIFSISFGVKKQVKNNFEITPNFEVKNTFLQNYHIDHKAWTCIPYITYTQSAANAHTQTF